MQAVTKVEASSGPSRSIQANQPRAAKADREATSNSGAHDAFPSVELPEALGYTQDLVDSAGREWVPILDAASLWFGKPYAAPARRAAAGLCDFGLVEQQGRGGSRKVRATELGWRMIKHAGTAAGLQAMREAISKPRLIAHYAREWQGAVPSTEARINQLRREQGFGKNQAIRFLTVLDQCLEILPPIGG